mmetsp:Transcript_29996/g.54005  ORF Transcript_29996/g.54005 Transcript_29996/m.54005 type:complete len:212 (-) Transcript_29996:603-1238(-)
MDPLLSARPAPPLWEFVPLLIAVGLLTGPVVARMGGRGVRRKRVSPNVPLLRWNPAVGVVAPSAHRPHKALQKCLVHSPATGSPVPGVGQVQNAGDQLGVVRQGPGRGPEHAGQYPPAVAGRVVMHDVEVFAGLQPRLHRQALAVIETRIQVTAHKRQHAGVTEGLEAPHGLGSAAQWGVPGVVRHVYGPQQIRLAALRLQQVLLHCGRYC